MKTATYNILNISCGHCVMTIESALGELEGVLRVNADADSKSVKVDYQDYLEEQGILDLLEKINYPAETN